MPCRQSWCNKCYFTENKLGFQINKPRDDEGNIWYKKEEDKDRYLYGRAGDHLMCPFQCDLCIFRLLKKSDPIRGSPEDVFLLASIRRINLDAMWAREPGTVRGNLSTVRRGVEMSLERGIAPPYPRLGPFPDKDVLGYGVALHMAWDSLEEGQYADYKQFSTVRRFRTAHANAWDASVEGGAASALMFASQDRNKLSDLCSGPTRTKWFGRFMRGMKTRMGEIVKQDLALTIDILYRLIELCRERIREQRGVDQALTISVATYLIICFMASLRGNEGFMVDLVGLKAYIDEGKTGDDLEHVVIPLLGRFKNEPGERYHLLPVATDADSILNPRWWLELLMAVREKQGIKWGPLFCSKEGKVASTSVYEEVFYDLLEEVREEYPKLFTKDTDIREDYGLSRSMRRGSTTMATLLGVLGTIIDTVNRWRTEENARGTRPGVRMREHYAEIKHLVPLMVKYARPFLRWRPRD